MKGQKAMMATVVVTLVTSACQSGVVPAGRAPTGPYRLAGAPAPGEAVGAPATVPATAEASAYAHFAVAVDLILDGQWEQALAHLERARALDPKQSRIELKIGECLDHLARRDEALAAYRRAAALGPDDFWTQVAVGEALAAQGHVAEAAQTLQRALASPEADPASSHYVVAVWRLAGLAARQRKVDEAIAYYTRLLDLLGQPKNDYWRNRQVAALALHREFVCEELGKLHLLAGDARAAVKVLEQGKALAPNSVTLTYRLADACLRDGQHARALAETDRLLDLAGDDPAALDLLLRIARAMKEPTQAVRRLETRLQAAPENPLLRLYLATSYREVNRLAQAEQLLRTVLEAQPRNPLVYAELAATLREERRPGAAMDALADAIDREAVDQPVLLEIDRVTDALKSDTPARQVWQTSAQGRPGSRGAQYLLGRLLAAVGEHDRAVAVLAEVVRTNPTFLWAYVDLAALHAQEKRYAEALEVYRGALAHGLSRNPLVYRMMAHLHERLDQLPEAMRVVEEALRIAPDDRRSRYLKAVLLERMRKDPEAEQAFRAILAEDPDDADANNALSYFLATRARGLEEARQLIDKALASEPENGAFLDTLGWVLYQQGRYAEALAALKRAAEAIKHSQPEGDPVILDHLGDAHERLRQYEDARRAWQQALDLNEKDRNSEIDPQKIREKLDALPR